MGYLWDVHEITCEEGEIGLNGRRVYVRAGAPRSPEATTNEGMLVSVNGGQAFSAEHGARGRRSEKQDH